MPVCDRCVCTRKLCCTLPVTVSACFMWFTKWILYCAMHKWTVYAFAWRQEGCPSGHWLRRPGATAVKAPPMLSSLQIRSVNGAVAPLSKENSDGTPNKETTRSHDHQGLLLIGSSSPACWAPHTAGVGTDSIYHNAVDVKAKPPYTSSLTLTRSLWPSPRSMTAHSPTARLL